VDALHDVVQSEEFAIAVDAAVQVGRKEAGGQVDSLPIVMAVTMLVHCFAFYQRPMVFIRAALKSGGKQMLAQVVFVVDRWGCHPL